MRRFLAVTVAAILMMSLLGACQNEKSAENTTESTVAEATTQAAEDTSEEASQELNLEKKVDIKTPKKVDQTAMPEEGETVAIIHVKDYGDISAKFFYEDSPLAVENFLTLAANGYYDGIIFHRVIQGFMIQGGDPTGTGMGGTSIWGKPFKNEYSDRLAHINGAFGMARTQALDTNESQFFINNGPKLDKTQLGNMGMSEELTDLYLKNGGNPNLQDQYTVFGQVYDGMDVVEAISAGATDTMDKPVEDIVIESIEVTEYKK